MPWRSSRPTSGSTRWRDCKVVVLAAVAHDGGSLKYATAELKADGGGPRCGASEGFSIIHASAGLKADTEVVRKQSHLKPEKKISRI